MSDPLKKFFDDRTEIPMSEKYKAIKKKHRLRAMKARAKLRKEIEEDNKNKKETPENEVEKWAKKKRKQAKDRFNKSNSIFTEKPKKKNLPNK